jgi:hypothetical protein
MRALIRAARVANRWRHHRDRFGDEVADPIDDQPHHPPRREVVDTRAMPSEESLGVELSQDRVVSLEGGEHVHVRHQRSQAVLGHVTLPTTGLAALCDGVEGVPAGLGFESGGSAFEDAALRTRVPRFALQRHVIGRQPGGGEVVGDRRSEPGHQPPLMTPVVDQQDLPTSVVRELTPAVGVADGDG